MAGFIIDELAPIMWVFILAFLFVLAVGIFRTGYFFIAAHPCESYLFLSHYFGPVGDLCIVNATVI
jgi:hypothetical protein